MIAWFFDMDGTLFDSMPKHAAAWETVLARYGISFPAAECYRNEGKRGTDIIRECFREQLHREPSEEEAEAIYRVKSEMITRTTDIQPIAGALDVLRCLRDRGDALWIVTGSRQQSLFRQLDEAFPGMFSRERMVTADDVLRGKPFPDPYIAAWQRASALQKDLTKAGCRVVENAPLGVISAKEAGMFTIAVNTGPLPDKDLWDASADRVFPSMCELKKYVLNNPSV